MAAAAWACGDPGMQYDTTINDWHTCSNTARINASNPCSEYMHVDNSACNLASLNLMKFLDEDGVFDVEVVPARRDDDDLGAGDHRRQQQLPDSRRSAKNTEAMRQLGLGYANLGAMLMSLGIPYDSDAGRAIAAIDHGDHDGTRVRDVGFDRAARRSVRGVPRKSRADVARYCQTP